MLVAPSAAVADDVTACFSQSPANPVPPGQAVTFNSSCSSGDIERRFWDLDNDNRWNDGQSTSVTRSWASSGTYTVRLAVIGEDDDDWDIATRTVTVNARPVANFTPPAGKLTHEKVTLTSSSTDSDGTIASYRWGLHSDGLMNDGTSRQITPSFSRPGTYNVTLEVTDDRGATATVTKALTIGNRPPVACLTRTPAAPMSGEAVTFDSGCTYDPDSSVRVRGWDLDADGDYDDGTGATATSTWTRPGTYTVRLGVIDEFGATHAAAHEVTVGNRAPTSAFTFAPARPLTGDTVSLTSTASDPDGSIAAHEWDLDGDGRYDDATGPQATFRPASARGYTVGLRVVDDSGAAAVTEQTIAVGARPAPRPASPPNTPADGGKDFDVSTPVAPPAPPPPLPPAPPAAPLRLLNPFPVVRMRGRTTPRGARLSLFSVRAPHGAVVRIACRGRGCPARKLRRTIAKKSQRGSRTVRFRKLERFLRAGVRLHVRVTQPGMVGKYTRIRIRRLKLPVRVDRCVLPGSAKPAACPEAP